MSCLVSVVCCQLGISRKDRSLVQRSPIVCVCVCGVCGVCVRVFVCVAECNETQQ